MKKPEEQWIEIPNTHAPIIEEYIFNAAQKMVRTKRRDESTAEPNIFAGLLRCSDCGWALGFVKGKTEGMRINKSFPQRAFQAKSPSMHDVWEKTVIKIATFRCGVIQNHLLAMKI